MPLVMTECKLFPPYQTEECGKFGRYGKYISISPERGIARENDYM